MLHHSDGSFLPPHTVGALLCLLSECKSHCGPGLGVGTAEADPEEGGGDQGS